MICKVEQVERMIRRRHEVKNLAGEIVYHARTPLRFVGEVIMDEALIRIRLAGRLNRFLITRDDIEVGEIKQELVVTKKILFLPIGYEIHKFSIDGHEYEVFESAFGMGKHFFSMYENGVVVGVIRKEDLIVNDLDKYTLFTEDETAMKNLVIYTMYLAATLYYKTADSTAGYMYDDDSVATIQQELLDKYDPSFISRILEKDRVTFDEKGQLCEME